MLENKQELLDLIKIGEGYTLEFKESYTDIGKEISAFANASGGKILIGVYDNENIKKFTLTNKIHSQIIDIGQKIDPSINLNVKEIDNITIITVPEGKEKPYAYSEQYYIRIGATSQKMKKDALRSFFQKEGLIFFDEKLNTNFNLKNDFNKSKFKNYLSKAGLSNITNYINILTNLSLYDNKYLKNAGVLLFSNKITKFFYTATIVCVLYQGTTKTEILDKKEFNTDLYSNFDNAFIYTCSKLNTNYIIKDKERKEKLELPKESIREALINAIAHKNYFLNAHIQVDIFYDRVEITNPGSLVSGISKEEFGKKSLSRNPLLFGLMQRVNLGEMIGSGITRIRNSMKEYGLEYKFDITENWFTIIFYRPKQALSSEKTVEKTVEKIIRLIKNNPNITTKELILKIGLTRRGIEYNLKKLKKDGKIKRIGPNKGGSWEVVKL
jgi:ATP-dependent DNA helicase RecG